MIDQEIEIILHDLIFHSKEISKYLRKQKHSLFDFYIDDLLAYVDSFEESAIIIKEYILNLEINLLKLKEDNLI